LDAKVKLETQLLKLKEQREALKDEGSVHDDKIMKENAKLQVNNNNLHCIGCLHFVSFCFQNMTILLILDCRKK
jgi:uncharacterized protein YjbK